MIEKFFLEGSLRIWTPIFWNSNCWREGFKEKTNNSMETWLVCLSSSNHHVRFFQVWNYGEAVGRNLRPQMQHDSIPMKYDIDVYNLVHKIKYVTSPRLETNAAPILSWFPCNILIACRHYNDGWPDMLPSNARQSTAPAIATTACTCMME